MNGTLPGLLDDPNIDNLELPTHSDVHIAPLRNPAPSRHGLAPLPLELIDSTYFNERGTSCEDDRPMLMRSATHDTLFPSREKELKKPYLAISELVDTTSVSENGQVQLPSFVSLSVVEKSPTQKQLEMNDGFPNKRIRLDSTARLDSDGDRYLLPRPIQKDDRNVRPLLPAMVTGLHEPPPSAAILPSMDLDTVSSSQRNAVAFQKLHVKDILSETQRASINRPPEQMINSPQLAIVETPKSADLDGFDEVHTLTSISGQSAPPAKDKKLRRIRRKWSVAETNDLLAGVQRYGFGKWKQILIDPEYTFSDRTSIDLKDRYRVFSKEHPPGTVIPPIEISPNEDDLMVDIEAPELEPTISASSQPTRQRRKRHPWTKEEDASLLSGVAKYGFQWTDIHKDADLNLSHRRATDLRDRIRNLYPDGYKHAEARPLRAEMKKAEKAGKKETPAGTLYAPPGQIDSMTMNFGEKDKDQESVKSSRRQTMTAKVPSIATLTSLDERPSLRRSKTVSEVDVGGITLPSLALDQSGDSDVWDNTLPPFINWEV